MDNFLTIVQNGYVPGQFFHIVLNGLLTAGVIIMAISAWHLLRNNATDFYRRSAKWGMVIALVFGTLGALAGHSSRSIHYKSTTYENGCYGSIVGNTRSCSILFW